MDESSKRWQKQARWLTQALIISGALNVGLLLTFFYLFFKEKHVSAIIDHHPITAEAMDNPFVESRSVLEVVRSFRDYSFGQLVDKLQDKKLIENGYTQRDAALAALVTYYYFNVQKALSDAQLQKRQLIAEKSASGGSEEIIIFPGLSDVRFQSIMHYAMTERWPLTSQGLFLQIKHATDALNPSLMDAFFLTPEFVEVAALFNHAKLSNPQVAADKYAILSMLREGDWPLIANFYREQRSAQDLSETRLQRLILQYIGQRSKAAARLMLQNYGDFAVKKLDDQQVAAILQLLKEKTPESERFAQELLVSPRSDEVLKIAAARLYQFAKEPPPETYDHIAALTKFIPESVLKEKIKFSEHALPAEAPVKQAVVKTESAPKPVEKKVEPSVKTAASAKKPAVQPQQAQQVKTHYHIVSEGETLWLIAKKYKVDIELLKAANGLESNSIYSGLVLRIPGTGS